MVQLNLSLTLAYTELVDFFMHDSCVSSLHLQKLCTISVKIMLIYTVNWDIFMWKLFMW